MTAPSSSARDSVAPSARDSVARSARDSVAAMVGRLRSEGLRMTSARRVLLSVLASDLDHPTAESLAAKVRAVAPDVNMSTIYRNLDELERVGIVVHAHLGHGAATYHVASGAHGHLVCDGCGETFDVADALFEDLAHQARTGHDFEIRPYHFAVPGLCATCRQTRSSIETGSKAPAATGAGRTRTRS